MDNVEIWDTPGASEAAQNIGNILESLGASKSVAMNQAFKLVEQFIRDNHLLKPRQTDDTFATQDASDQEQNHA